MKIEVWLYGVLSLYASEKAEKGFASVQLELSEGTKVGELLKILNMPTEERGITFINGNLSALPGLQPDLDQELMDGDRISFFDHRSMWPFQYRHGAAMASGLNQILNTDPEAIMHHKPTTEE
ncbi:MAG: MoaD/ThiS family protein [Anaerolineaceae bacterium]|nr:MoaD/ThiS family protein [Anaerolineaceae bacterium]